MNDACASCGSTEDLQQHHISYKPEKTVTLCVDCHQRAHPNQGVGDPNDSEFLGKIQPLEVNTEFNRLAALLKATGNQVRLAILRALNQQRGINLIPERFDITRSGVQKHLDMLIEQDLVYRPPESDKTYELTPLGEFFADFVEEYAQKLMTTLEAIEEAKVDAQKELTDVPTSDKEFEKLVTARMWDLIEERDTPL